MNNRSRAYSILLLVTIIWGIAGPVIKATLNYFPPSVFLIYRFAISSIIGLFFIKSITKHFPKNIEDIAEVLIYGLMTTTIGLGLLFLGFDNTSSFAATVISAASPIFVAI